MPTNFPGGLDDFPDATTLASQTLGTSPHSTLHGNLGEALEAVEAKIGVDNSTVTTTLDYKTRTLRTDVDAHVADTTDVHGIADTSTLYRQGGTDVAVADGGTGASDAATARANLGAAAASHTHAAADVTSGVLAQARIATGTASAGTAPVSDGAGGTAWTDVATQAELDAHINDASDAHDASAISFSPAGGVAATDVQAAIAELDSEKAAASHTHGVGSLTLTATDRIVGRTSSGSGAGEELTAAQVTDILGTTNHYDHDGGTTISNSSAEATLYSSSGARPSIAANSLAVGDVFRLTAMGRGACNAGGDDTFTFRVKLGSTTIATLATAAIPAQPFGYAWFFGLTFAMTTIGASGALVVFADLKFFSPITGATISESLRSSAGQTTSFDTTIDRTIDVTGQISAASTSLTIISDSIIWEKVSIAE